MPAALNPANVSLNYFVQETWSIPVACLDRILGTPLDITNGFLALRIASNTALMFDISLSAAAGTGTFTGGLATMVIAAGAQSSVQAGTFNYEIRSISADGSIDWVQQYGLFTLSPSLFAQFPWVPPGQAPGQLDFSNTFQSGLIGH